MNLINRALQYTIFIYSEVKKNANNSSDKKTGNTSSHKSQKPSRFSLGGKGIWHRNQPREHVGESGRPARESAGSPLMCCSPKIIHGSDPLNTKPQNCM